MSDKKEFYIGWQDKMPETYWKTIKKLIIPIFIAIPILGFIVVNFQKPFNAHTFEFGDVKEFTGIYHQSPVPILSLDVHPVDPSFSKDLLLVGYGKFGAEGIIKDISEEKGDLNGKKITLKGTLIYGDGKTILELTEQKNSLVKIHSDKTQQTIKPGPLKDLNLQGQILDPKCYFGVMKPAEGKVHKSCAIRCISGGIPPVFRTKNSDNQYEYYLIRGLNGEAINKDLLPFVAEQLNISGKSNQVNGWHVLYTSLNAISSLN